MIADIRYATAVATTAPRGALGELGVAAGPRRGFIR